MITSDGRNISMRFVNGVYHVMYVSILAFCVVFPMLVEKVKI